MLLVVELLHFAYSEMEDLILADLFGFLIDIEFFHSFENYFIPGDDLLEESDELFYGLSRGLYFLE